MGKVCLRVLKEIKPEKGPAYVVYRFSPVATWPRFLLVFRLDVPVECGEIGLLGEHSSSSVHRSIITTIYQSHAIPADLFRLNSTVS
jgi:hypothetical protein